MKIIHLFHYYYPVLGGLERAVQKLAENQRKLKHQVHVITSYLNVQGRPKEEILNDVHIHRIKS